MIGIYKITNLVNGKVYIGQSVNIHKRWVTHRNAAFNPNKDEYEAPLYKAIRKYGLDKFLFDVLEECAKCDLDEREIFYIDQYKSHNRRYGYNQNRGGSNAKNPIKLSEDVVLKIIDVLRTSTETNQKIAEEFGISERMVRSINYGECWPIESINYPIRYVRPRSPNGQHMPQKPKQKTKQCVICKALIDSKATYCKKCYNEVVVRLNRKSQRPGSLELAKMIIDNGFVKVGEMFGVSDNAIKGWLKSNAIPDKKKELVDWYNQQMGIAAERPKPKNGNKERSVPVKQIHLLTRAVINVFPSINSATRAMGKKTSTKISNVCKGRARSAYGYGWEFA